MKKTRLLSLAGVLLALTGCTIQLERDVEDSPDAMTRLADETLQHCPEAASAAASGEELAVTFEHNFKDPNASVEFITAAAKKCLVALAEADLSPGELAIQVVDTAEFAREENEETHPMVLRAVYQKETVGRVAQRLKSDTGQDVWALADDREVTSSAGQSLVDAAK